MKIRAGLRTAAGLVGRMLDFPRRPPAAATDHEKRLVEMQVEQTDREIDALVDDSTASRLTRSPSSKRPSAGPRDECGKPALAPALPPVSAGGRSAENDGAGLSAVGSAVGAVSDVSVFPVFSSFSRGTIC